MGRPAYHDFVGMDRERDLGVTLARQVVATVAPYMRTRLTDAAVLDLGCGYGDAAGELARLCRSVVGMEPARDLYETACRDHPGVTFIHGGVENLDHAGAYDLVILDNVYEHLSDHADALDRIARSLRPGGLLYLLAPNRLWPIEAHYRLPFLSWLPLPLANAYLRRSGRGADYTDASYAPTAWGLWRALRRAGLGPRFVLPGDPSATRSGAPWHYRAGMAAIDKFPALWAVSKALLVVARKP